MSKARRDDENLRVIEAFGAAYVAGVSLKFKNIKVESAGASVDLPLYPFEPTVYVSVGELTDFAISRMRDDKDISSIRMGAASALKEKDYGITNLFEESWLPRVTEKVTSNVVVPNYMVYVCTESADAAGIIAAIAPSGRNFSVVVPKNIERDILTLLNTKSGSCPSLVPLDLSDEGDRFKEVLSGPKGTGHVGLVFVSSASTRQKPELKYTTDYAYHESARLLLIFRYLVELGIGDRLRMWVVTNRAKAAVQGDRVENLGGVLWAMTKSALQVGGYGLDGGGRGVGWRFESSLSPVAAPAP